MSVGGRPFPLSEGIETMVERHRRKSAPTGAVTPHGRGLADRKDTDRLMAIMPAPPDPTSTCTAPRVDGCPECVVNAEQPYLHLPFTDSCVAAYRCADCQHSWETTWGRR